jgi:hypothetical protein
LKKVTVPAGTAPLAGVTVAVSVRGWPNVKSVAEAERLVAVAMPFTVTETGGADCEGASLEEPP